MTEVMSSRRHRFVSWLGRFMGWDDVPAHYLKEVREVLAGRKKQDRPTKPEEARELPVSSDVNETLTLTGGTPQLSEDPEPTS
jgi:hypothetical protein